MPGETEAMDRIDLLHEVPPLRSLFRARSFEFLARLPGFALFYVVILAGILGSPVGSRNIAITAVWILWWFLLIAVLVPSAGRIWCTVCPIPMAGDWLQRGSLTGVRTEKEGPTRSRLRGFAWRWPRRLRGMWLQNLGFLALATASPIVVTRPAVTAWLLLGLLALATGLALVFRLRAFCQYLCPIAGFLSIYSPVSRLGLRVRDEKTCRSCRPKGCILGSETGWACPWGLCAAKLDRNNDCGLCMECLKSCPHDNVSLFWGPGRSLELLRRNDEAFKASIMLALAAAYLVTLFGPWGTLKDWVNPTETGDWLGFGIYAAAVWGVSLGVVPALLLLSALASRALTPVAPLAVLFRHGATTLVPLGLAAWVAFSVPLVMIQGSYVLSTVSDPFGWGWDVFGTANVVWSPLWPSALPYLQAAIVLAGLGLSLAWGHRLLVRLGCSRRSAELALAPLAVLLSALTSGFLWFFVF